MKNCVSRDEFLLFSYGEINAGKKRAIENHINDCAACRMEIESFSSVRVLLRNAAADQEPSHKTSAAVKEASHETMRKIRGSIYRQTWPAQVFFGIRRFFYAAGIAGAAAASFVLIMYIIKPAPPNKSVPSRFDYEAGIENIKQRVGNISIEISVGTNAADYYETSIAGIRSKINALENEIKKDS